MNQDKRKLELDIRVCRIVSLLGPNNAFKTYPFEAEEVGIDEKFLLKKGIRKVEIFVIGRDYILEKDGEGMSAWIKCRFTTTKDTVLSFMAPSLYKKGSLLDLNIARLETCQRAYRRTCDQL